ncbi:hypothetical protein [Halomonas sp. MS1]|nr:hypothetical protein [Halomonas sp. MS1]UTD55929.1 hypothetical protein NF683_01540 [Halomonas sp. MS1]
MNFTAYQLTLLALRGIKPAHDLYNGTIQCSTPDGVRYYTASDLVQLAKPGFMDRFTAWIGKGVSA